MSGFWRIDPETWDEAHVTDDPEMTGEQLTALNAACSQLFADELQRKPDPKPERGCPFDEQF